MKTLKQLREEYDSNYLPQELPEELVLEATLKSKPSEFKGKPLSGVPSPMVMPSLLMFRRITYRKYPDDQTVALYYSKTVDKYLSIPFGPTGNLNLSESTMYDSYEDFELYEGAKWEAVKGGLKGAVQGAAKGLFKGNAIAAEPGMAIGAVAGGVHGAYKGAKNAYQKAKAKENLEETEAWQRKEGQNPEGGLNRKGIASYRKANPGSKLSMAVTTKPSKLKKGSKAANRRKSFCARMGGMKKRLTSAKTANDPDSRINKALRKWNCEEDFKMKLYEMRMQQNEGVADVLDAGAEAIVPYYSAGKKLYKGDYKGAATDAAVDTALLATGAVAGKALAGGAKLAGKGLGKLAGKLSGKKAKPSKVPPSKTPKAPKRGLPDLPDLSPKTDSSSQDSDAVKKLGGSELRKAHVKSYTPSMHGGDSAIDASRKNTLMRKEYDSSTKKQVAENKMSDLRDMIVEGIDSKELSINGRTVTLNSSMAKRILEVYDSVNSKNKKIVENMLNEDLESFKRLLTFSIRN
jgi:hypothetical protein